MTRVILLIPAFAGTFFLGRSFGQEVQTFCDECESTYVSAEEIQEYLEVASADQQVRSLDIGDVQMQVAISPSGEIGGAGDGSPSTTWSPRSTMSSADPGRT